MAARPSTRSTWWAWLPLLWLMLIGLLPLDWLLAPAARRQLQLSLILAGGSAVLAVSIALPLAMALTRVQIIGRSFAWLIVWLLLFTPLYVQLAGWDAVGGALHLFGRKEPLAPLTGIASATWVHGIAAVPWAIVLIAAGLTQVPRHEEELALLEAPPLGMFEQILLPRIKPWIIAAGCFAALISWQDMTVTNVYLVPTVTEGIYNQIAINRGFGAAGDAVNAVVHLWPGIVVLTGLFCLAGTISQRILQADFPRNTQPLWSWPMFRQRNVVSVGVWLLLIVLAGVPLFVLVREAGLQRTLVGDVVTRNWSLPHLLQMLLRMLRTMHQDFQWSLLISGVAATLAVSIAIIMAWWARKRGWRLFWITLVATLLLAIPGPLLSLAVMKALNQPAIPGFIYLYDRTIAAPALAAAIRAFPLALLIVWHALARFDQQQLFAAALDGCGPWTILGRIVLPQRWRAMVAAWGLAFAIGIGDVASTQLVIPAGIDTVARRIFGMVHSGVDDQVAAACLLLIGGMGMGATFLILAARKKF